MRDEHRIWTRCPFCVLILNKQQKDHLRRCGRAHGKSDEEINESIDTLHHQMRDKGYEFTRNQSIPVVLVRGVLAAHRGGEVAEACIYGILAELDIKVIDHPSVYAIQSQAPDRRMVSHISLHAIIKYIPM